MLETPFPALLGHQIGEFADWVREASPGQKKVRTWPNDFQHLLTYVPKCQAWFSARGIMSTWSAGRGSKRMAPAPGGQAAFLRAWGFGVGRSNGLRVPNFRMKGGL